MNFDINNILNAHNYELICDYTFLPAYGKNLPSDINTKSGNIFCKTDFVLDLFSKLSNSQGNYNLITHHSDYPITKELFNKKPKCIKKWFGLNPVFDHPDLIPLPLGLKTHAGYYVEPRYMTEWFANNINILRQKPKKENIYCNWTCTNVDRNKIIKQLEKNNLQFTYDTNLSFDKYIGRMANHKFVISPPGNGIDCHRTWEALYVGCIPIVIEHLIYKNWKNLPILQVKDYADIKQDLLDEFSSNLSYDITKLNIEYWNNKIKS